MIEHLCKFIIILTYYLYYNTSYITSINAIYMYLYSLYDQYYLRIYNI